MDKPQATGNLTGLHFKTLTEAADSIQSREISSLEVTTAILNRIASLDVTLKSYATVMEDHALASAKRADNEIAAGRYRGPLHGIPIAVKDLCFTKGIRTMGGTAVLAEHVPEYDSTVVERLESAGAVLLGKLNLTEGAMAGYHPDLDIPVNPWNKRVWSGASSSGSGVAVAAGLAYATLGSDTGGSIRFPAASCGVVGLKPTWGRVSRYGVLALAESLDHIGPLTRSTADAAAVLQAIAGHDPNDPTSLPGPVPDISAGMDGGVKGLRIGLDEQYVFDKADWELAEAVVSGVQTLKTLGAEIVNVTLPDLDAFMPAWVTLCTAEAVLAHEATYPSRRDDYGPWFRGWLDLGSKVSGADYARANNMRAALNGLLRGVFEKIDLLACPSMSGPPMPVTEEELYGSMEGFVPSDLRFTAPFDFNGAPTLSVPCGFSQDGLPLSLQFVGHYLSEPLLCQVGYAYQEVTEWHKARPTMA
jgi:amidase